MDIEDILAGVKLPQRTIPLCLRGDLQAEFEDLERQLRQAEATDDDSLAGGGTARELAELIEAVRQQMAEHTTVFRFESLTARGYSDLLTQHQPTEAQKREGATLNGETFPTALIAACAIDPKMTPAQAKRLSEAVTHLQWEDLFNCALACNRQAVDVPFSLSASAIRASSEPRPSQPAPGESPGDDSSAGSLAE
jgi:hypothetical protein